MTPIESWALMLLIFTFVGLCIHVARENSLERRTQEESSERYVLFGEVLHDRGGHVKLWDPSDINLTKTGPVVDRPLKQWLEEE